MKQFHCLHRKSTFHSSVNADIEAELQEIKDLRYRVQVSSQMLPSTVMYTFHNTYNGYT